MWATEKRGLMESKVMAQCWGLLALLQAGKWGPVAQKSHTAGEGGAEMAEAGRPGSRVLPVNWAKWVSRGLEAREM